MELREEAPNEGGTITINFHMVWDDFAFGVASHGVPDCDVHICCGCFFFRCSIGLLFLHVLETNKRVML